MTGHLLSAIYEPLVALSPGSGVEPCLARDWTTPDDTTWRLRLRQDVRFHDGRPLTADDVMASLERVRGASRSAVISNLEAVTSVRRLPGTDDGIEVRTSGPFPLLLARLANLAIVPADFEPTNPIGTGPYRWRGEAEKDLVLERWVGYWGEPAPMAEVRIRFISGEELLARPELLEVIDCVPRVPPAFSRSYLPRPGWRVARSRSVSTLILGMGTHSPPLADLRVRQAIDLAIDRRELVDTVEEHRFSEVASSLVPAEVFGYTATSDAVAVDRARARQLLAEAGVAEGTGLTLFHAGANDGVLGFVVSTLADIGLEVELEEQGYEAFYRSIESEIPGLFLFAWSFRFADASDFLDSMVHSRDQNGLLGRLNASGYCKPRVDLLIERANREASSSRRLQLLREALREVAEDRPYLPLVHPARSALIRDPFRILRQWGAWPRPQEIGVG
jgi:peptide/nickel transport system substrate-binding protein